MQPIVLVCPLAKSLPNIRCDYMGVDAGALLLANNKIMMEYSIGDFDSMDEKYQSLVQKYSIHYKKLNPIKDDSDLEAAIILAKEAGYKEIYVVGAIEGRSDHFYVNLKLMMREKEVKVILIDETNRLEIFTKGKYDFTNEIYKYFSVFALEPTVISLDNFKYPLKHTMITPDDVYTLSNEVNENGVMTIHQGRVLVIQANDMKKANL